ncbi:hypothetical protein A2160_05320 [Candidatus Beckwithbacteria bacterium RBG_13_42_9]|uniref:Pyridoxamine 5'-phosphate oxidase N-terminal domain-containing protein n=1 Tax=Candidatus Beckwithbacteria bacterium RBG_13_42_9 TaxID=1797457 RepID=A0A1F5E6V3_9BACT|nr:MAG: hypothetical protein A2160_05320 [Candidatus Beckwithbacteria bacterium RBG_13_42_9]
MTEQKLHKLARKIIKRNIYMTLATADRRPWASPVFYGTDGQLNFYYASLKDAVHSRNIAKNGQVAFAIFDSHQKEGTGNGVQGYGQAKQLRGLEVLRALRWYHTSFFPHNLETFRKVGYYRLYKITPQEFYVLDPDAKVDKRVAVKLN